MAISKRFASEEYVNESYAPISHSHSWADSGEQTTYGDTLTWDGNTDGLESDNDNVFFKVYDVPLTQEDFSNGCSVVFGGETYDISASDIIFNADGALFNDLFIIVPTDGYTLVDEIGGTFYFTTKGVYFGIFEGMYTSSLTINGYNGFKTTETVPLPNKYLDFIDTVGGDTLVWDGNTDGLYSALDTIYHVSEVIPTLTDLQNGGTVEVSTTGTEEKQIITFTAENIMDGATAGIGTDFIIISTGLLGVIIATSDKASMTEDGTTIPFGKAGVYFSGAYDEGSYIYTSSLTINGYTGFTKDKIKHEYLDIFETGWVDTLMFDGDLTGKTYVSSDVDGMTLYIVQLSESVPTLEELQAGGTAVIQGMGEITFDSSMIVDGGSFIDIGDGTGLVIKEDNTDLTDAMGVVFPKKGVYVVYAPDMGMVIESITFNNCKFPVNKLKTELLPDVGEEVDMSQYFKNSTGDMICWDGDITGRVVVENASSTDVYTRFVKVLDLVPDITESDFINGGKTISYNGTSNPYRYDEREYSAGEISIDRSIDGVLGITFVGAMGVLIVKVAGTSLGNYVFPETGVYLIETVNPSYETVVASTRVFQLYGCTKFSRPILKHDCLPKGIGTVKKINDFMPDYDGNITLPIDLFTMFVTFSGNDADGWTCDKTRSEIIQAIQDGYMIRAILPEANNQFGNTMLLDVTRYFGGPGTTYRKIEFIGYTYEDEYVAITRIHLNAEGGITVTNHKLAYMVEATTEL